MKKLKASHAAIEDAIQGHLNELEIDGLMTGWTVTVSLAHLDGDDEFDALYNTQSDGLSKWAHIGMLTSSLDSVKEYGLQD